MEVKLCSQHHIYDLSQKNFFTSLLHLHFFISDMSKESIQLQFNLMSTITTYFLILSTLHINSQLKFNMYSYTCTNHLIVNFCSAPVKFPPFFTLIYQLYLHI